MPLYEEVVEMVEGDKFVLSLVELFSKLNTYEREKTFPKPTIPRDYTPTEKIVHKMLIENTGANVLDSGDIYGRNWERNRFISDFRKVPRTSIKVYDDEVLVRYHVFHYVVDHCEYDEKLDKEFHKFANTDEYTNESWLTCMEAFCEEYLRLKNYQWRTVNTYNYENILSQVLQYTIFTFDNFYDSCYIILQSHNGCDVRGGYSTPHVFKVNDHDYFIMAQFNILASCPKCAENWFSDDAGFHWYNNMTGEIDVSEEWILDEHENKVFHKKCGHEITFDVFHSY